MTEKSATSTVLVAVTFFFVIVAYAMVASELWEVYAASWQRAALAVVAGIIGIAIFPPAVEALLDVFKRASAHHK